ncbi:Thiol:disulfide oxidoreductase related to ResA [Minicystis rosea]|nr:Thiol:disulfide oxidoreductase related to ResA [Minicystis rosea]
MRTWIAFLTFVIGCSAVEGAGDHAAGTVAQASSKAPPGEAHALPQVSLVGFDNSAVRLEQAAAGKPALVSFWATWCEACATEFGALNRLEERAHATGGVVIGVDVGEPREKAAAFARAHGLKYMQLVDEKLELADALGQKRLPATLVLDRHGQVVFVGGALDEKALAAFRGAIER